MEYRGRAEPLRDHEEAQLAKLAYGLSRRMRYDRKQFYAYMCERPVVFKYPNSAELVFNRLHRHVERPPEVKRGLIHKFSPASVRRFRKSIQRAPKPFTHFLTITFPPEIWWHFNDKGGWRGYVRFFLQEFRKAAAQGGAQYIWVREPQKNGRPHYHILCTHGVALAGHAWAINARFLTAHRAITNGANIRAEVLRSGKAAASYMGKVAAYCAKAIELYHEESWRHWGRNYVDAQPEVHYSTWRVWRWLMRDIFPRLRVNRFPLIFDLPDRIPIGPPVHC